MEGQDYEFALAGRTFKRIDTSDLYRFTFRTPLPNKDWFNLVVKSKTTTIQIGEDGRAKYEIRNRNDKPVFLYRNKEYDITSWELEAGRFSIKDEGGKDIVFQETAK